MGSGGGEGSAEVSNQQVDLGLVWAEVVQELATSHLSPQQRAWMRVTRPIGLLDGTALLAAPSDFAKEAIERALRDPITAALSRRLGRTVSLAVKVDSPEPVSPPTTPIPVQTVVPSIPTGDTPVLADEAVVTSVSTNTDTDGSDTDEVDEAGDALAAVTEIWPTFNTAGGAAPNGNMPYTRPANPSPSQTRLNEKYNFDTFVIGASNRFAHAAAVAVAEAPARAYNPLFIWGESGLGKTHLLHAVGHYAQRLFPGMRVRYVSTEEFTNDFINSLRDDRKVAFQRRYRDIDVLLVDDIQFLEGKEGTQEEFFHTFNTLYNAGKQIVLSSDSPPKDIPTLQDRLVSRFKWGMVTEIEPPCFETRVAIVKRKSRDRGHEMSDDVCQLLAERVETNVRELEGAVTKLLGYAGMTHSPITKDLARRVLRDVFVQRRGAPTLDDIGKAVTEYFGVKLSDLQSKRRTQSVAYPRQVAMYLARAATRHSLEEIGGFFGGRDHSTVLYAVEKISKRIETDAACSGSVQELRERLQLPDNA